MLRVNILVAIIIRIQDTAALSNSSVPCMQLAISVVLVRPCNFSFSNSAQLIQLILLVLVLVKFLNYF